MEKPDWAAPLGEAFARASAYLEGLPSRPVGSHAEAEDLRAVLGGPLPDGPTEPREVIAALADGAEPGMLAVSSGRFFGFVIGGATPTALAADWLTSTWDQNAGLYVAGPPAAVVEEIAGDWLVDLLGLPPQVSVGFVTGAQMAHVTGLAAARNEVLRRHGWDVETAGLTGAPRIRVLAGEDRHDTVDRALRFLGLGTASVTAVESDAQGRMRPDRLRAALAAGTGDLAVGGPAGMGRRSCVRRRGTSTPARWTRSARSSTRRTRPGRGSTSTARSGCGPPRARPSPRFWPASSGPTRGRRTRTSG